MHVAEGARDRIPSATSTQHSTQSPYHFGATRSIGPFEGSVQAKRKQPPRLSKHSNGSVLTQDPILSNGLYYAPPTSQLQQLTIVSISLSPPTLVVFFLFSTQRHHSCTSIGLLPFAHTHPILSVGGRESTHTAWVFHKGDISTHLALVSSPPSVSTRSCFLPSPLTFCFLSIVGSQKDDEQ